MNVILGVFLIAALILAGCAKLFHDKLPPVDIPAPLVLRKDLLMSYYGAVVHETVNHTNLFFAGTWHGQDHQLREVIAAHNAGLPIILDVADQMALPWEPDGPRQRLRDRLQQIKEVGAIGSIIAFYFDEPDLQGRMSEADVISMANVMRSVAAPFGITPKIAMVYTNGQTWPGISVLDWAGFDSYGSGDQIFVNGEYAALKAHLRSDQRIILVPGGAKPWAQSPTQFFNMAQADEQVIALLPFAWTGGNESGKASGWDAGIRSNGLTAEYTAIGLKIKNP